MQVTDDEKGVALRATLRGMLDRIKHPPRRHYKLALKHLDLADAADPWEFVSRPIGNGFFHMPGDMYQEMKAIRHARCAGLTLREIEAVMALIG